MADDSRPDGIAFLLSQLGAFAAQRFADRVAPLGLTPADCGVLRVLSQQPGPSQQELAQTLGTQPSRVVALVDGLESAGYVRRARDRTDRRRNTIELTARGRRVMSTIGRSARAHEAEVSAPLSPDERAQLHELLGRLAQAGGLEAGVHPGYRSHRTG